MTKTTPKVSQPILFRDAITQLNRFQRFFSQSHIQYLNDKGERHGKIDISLRKMLMKPFSNEGYAYEK
jgi:hypothetical protein